MFKILKKLIIFIGLTLLTILSNANNLDFNVNIGTDNNYFIQNNDGAFHVLLRKDPKPLIILASPAGNNGFVLNLSGNNEPKMISPPKINSKENTSFSVEVTDGTKINSAILGSIRVVRDYVEGDGAPIELLNKSFAAAKAAGEIKFANTLDKWMHPKWQLSDNGKDLELNIIALDGKNSYLLKLHSLGEDKFSIEQENPPQVKVNTIIGLPKKFSITYSSTYKPLTPFPEDELFNSKALKILSTTKDKEMLNQLNGLRFLTYKEKLLAGSWRFITYFGRDSLMSLRLLTPVLTPEAIEAGFKGATDHLIPTGQISHEESLSDQAVIDQLDDWINKGQSKPFPKSFKVVTNNYNMVDEDFLLLPLLLDYYQIGGTDAFKTNNELFLPILKNINLVFEKTKNNNLVKLLDGFDTGDWRDSQSGLGFGRYSFSVNAGIIPAAIYSFSELLEKGAWGNKDALLRIAKENHLDALANILENEKDLTIKQDKWFNMWQKFLVKQSPETMDTRMKALSNYLKLPDPKITPPYQNGFLALSLDNKQKPIDIIQSDTVFLLQDFPINKGNNWLDLALKPFQTDILNGGLFSDAGIIVATPALAPKNYIEMFDQNKYQGMVTWQWPQLYLKMSLLKQLGEWVTPAPNNHPATTEDKDHINNLLSKVSKLLTKLQKWSTSELWSWKYENGKFTPIAYGQQSGNETESNAIQLWSVAGLGLETWDIMRETQK